MKNLDDYRVTTWYNFAQSSDYIVLGEFKRRFHLDIMNLLIRYLGNSCLK